ncbi:toll/interleukin-1 receptor domain-containing protein [Streptomyces mutabilis]|uniref:toll/interleukin-1 receptor domain-containing protein n=1 Tax=Streptomyces mutabilis TaxID=67332 RepID=UPI003685E8A8
MRYAAFISYSHAPDTRRAHALRQALHTFARPWNRMRALRVFLDNAAMSAERNIWGTVEQALGDSEYLILLASPDSRRSEWVGREIEWWRQGPRAEKLLLVVTDGEIHWDHVAGDFDFERSTCLHSSLRGHFTAEPRWVDLRWMAADQPGDLREPRFREAVADLAAPLHGRPKDELIGEDVTQRRRFRRFRRSMLAGITALAVLATSAAVFAFVQRDTAREQARIATARQLAATALNLRDDDLDVASLLALQAHRLEETPETLAAVYQLASESPRLVRFVRTDETVTALALSNSPRYVAIGTGRGTVEVWTADGTRKVRTLELSGAITMMRFSGDDGLLAVAADTGETVVQHLRNEGGPRRLAGGDTELRAMAFHAFEPHLTTIDDKGELRSYDVAGGKPTTFGTGVTAAMNLALLDEGGKVFVGHAAGWSLFGSDGERMTELDSSDSTVYPFNDYLSAASPTGSCYGYVKYGEVSLYSPAEIIRPDADEPTRNCGVPPGMINKEAEILAVSDDGRAAVGTSDGLLVSTSGVQDRPQSLEYLNGVEAPAVLTFSPGAGDRLASADGRTVALWSLDRPGPTAHPSGVALSAGSTIPQQPALVVRPDGGVTWSEEPDTTENPRTWTPGDPADRTVVGQGSYWMYDALAYGEDGRILYATTDDGLEVWSASSDSLVRKQVVNIARDRDFSGRTLVAAGPGDKVTVVPPDGSVLLVDPATGRMSTAVKAREGEPGERAVYQQAVGEEGGVAAVQGADGRLEVYELPSGRRLHTLDTGASSVQALTVSEENHALYAVVDGDILERWDLEKGTLEWRSYGAGEYGVAADAAGRWAATLAGDGAVWLWDARTGARLGSTTLPAPSTVAGTSEAGRHSSLAFSADGGTLWSATEGGELMSWDTSPDAWAERLCDRVGRPLTSSERARYLTSLSDGITACER